MRSGHLRGAHGNCIGQELALVVRRFDFPKFGIGALIISNAASEGVLVNYGRYEVEKEMYTVILHIHIYVRTLNPWWRNSLTSKRFKTRQVTTKSVDGTIMQVRLA